MDREYIKQFKEVEVPKILEETTPFINPEKLDAWKEILALNSDNGFRIAMLKVIVEMIMLLGNDVSFDEMSSIVNHKYSLTLWHMATAVGFASRVSIRGKELTQWWNNMWDAKDNDKVVNPAILTLEPKKGNELK